MKKITVIGAGLAGSEAAWRIANSEIEVDLWEMRPKKMTPAHHTGYLGELVCSNSLKADHLGNAAGLLKAEMRELGSIVISTADSHSVPAGQALAVDRQAYAEKLTERISQHPLINLHYGEVGADIQLADILTEGITIIASGPLTSEPLAKAIAKMLGRDYLYFFDAAAPIVNVESLDQNVLYRASRYGNSGEGDYLNSPLSKSEYELFCHELVNAQQAQVKDFETGKFFESCLPIEEIASRGEKTLAFGPLKPVGLPDPRTNRLPYAVVQLRQDNLAGTLYNLVGFQTRLQWGEQKRVFSLLPGFSKAEFFRYGVMHRNTFINSPQLLSPTLLLKDHQKVLFAGQIVGVEGYVESAAMGIIAGINAVFLARGDTPVIFPQETAHGALTDYITTTAVKTFQPMNINFGLLPILAEKIKDKKLKKQKISQRGLKVLGQFIKENDL